MSLSPGTKIGPYVVVEPIGAGGMGEVFRAVDTRLKRDVAIKSLPPSAVDDAQKRARFDREAQVLASLNHPAIAQVFGVEMDGDTPVIVMEYVTGETLADRLRKGAIPLDEVIPIAAQICDGLEAAHDNNIVHRDLKPANIKVRPDGTIKILDFGIARVLATDTAVDRANSPTHLGGSTDAGIILGTASYMSPEQARAKPVDKRTDVWAFGCILFEMLSGKQAFAGESTTDILADIVKKEPEWTALPASLPDRLVELMARCLQKNSKDRLRDIADARYELTFATTRGESAAAGSRSPLPFAAMFAAGAIVAAIVLLATPLGRREAPAPQQPNRVSIDLPPEMTISLGRGSSVILSPDGRTLVFVGRVAGKSQLYLRPLDRFEAQPLAGTEDATNPFFSPDGRWIGFFAASKLKKLSLDGGAPVTIAEIPNARGQEWGPNDTIYVTPNNTAPIQSIPAMGGKLQPVTVLKESQLSHRWPRVLPDGKAMLFSVWNDNGFESSRIAAQRFGSQDQVTVLDVGGGFPRYVRDSGTRGYLVYARAEGLLAVPFDESTLSVSGQAVPLADGVLTNLSGGAHFDVAASGTLAYLPGTAAEDERQLIWMTLDGKATPSRTIRGLTRTWKLSPDGTRIARNNGGGPSDVWVENLFDNSTTRVTQAPELYNFNPVWTPDGKSLIYGQGLTGSSMKRKSADGTGNETPMTADDARTNRNFAGMSPFSVSPDGKWLSYYEIDPATSFDILIVPLPASGAAPDPKAARMFVKTPGTDGSSVFSNDMKWLAYQSNESGRFEVYLRSFPDGERTLRVSTEGGVSPIFSPKGDELYYRSLDGKLKAVPLSAAPGFQDKVRVLFDASKYDNNFAIAPDGRLLMMPLVPAEFSASRINVVFNLLTELRQRVK